MFNFPFVPVLRTLAFGVFSSLFLFVFFVSNTVAESRFLENEKICVIGSSSAAGYGASQPDRNWVSRFSNFSKGVVHNLAKPGALASISLEGCPYGLACSECVNSKVALISFPSNDVVLGGKVEDVISVFKKIDDKCRQLGLDCVVVGIQPRNYPAGFNPMLRSLDFELSKIFNGRYVQLFKVLSDPQGNLSSEYASPDGVHLNDLGHKVVANEVLNTVFGRYGGR